MQVSGVEYEVDGEIIQTNFAQDGGVRSVKRSHFSVFVRDCSWLIQTRDHDEAGKLLLVRETGCNDGKEIDEVEGDVLDDKEAGTARGVGTWNVGSIVSNSVPVGQMDDYIVSHLWLMFASGCHFSSLSSNWLTPVYDVNASVPVNPNLKREAKWELVHGPGTLPLNVVYLDKQDVTNATYFATGMTNVGERRMAAGFVFEQRVGGSHFSPGPVGPGETAPSYRVRKRAVATVTAVSAVCSRTDLVPAAKGMTIVVDERPPQNPAQKAPPSYVVQNGVKWVGTADAKGLYVPQKTPEKHSAVAIIIFMIFNSIVVFMLVLNQVRRKGK